MIRIEDLTKRYSGTVVLEDLNLSVARGESVALWGPNGAGKTTIILCLLGFLEYEGLVRVAGLDVRNAGKAVRSLIGYVPQQPGFYDDLTVAESLGFSAALRAVDLDRVEEVISIVGIDEQRHKRVGALSGGMRQRLGLAVALLADPEILLLDEPTSNLDASSRQATIELLEMLREEGRTMVVTSHHLEEVSMLVDRVVVLESGSVVDECAPAELSERLGLRSWIHLLLDPEDVAPAMETLAASGFDAQLNGRGVLINVAPADKGDAIGAITGAGIAIRDVEVWR